jgi:predicted DNA-binding transcriptional regulator AlpA
MTGSADSSSAGKARAYGPDRISFNPPTTKTGAGIERLLTPKEAAHFLRLSLSWAAKARMRGDGPPYIKIGRAIRYSEAALLQWMKSRTRTSTCQSR